MTKKEIFLKILEICADVCSVDQEEIIKGCRKEDVCTARALLVFWCDAAGLSVESMKKYCECNNSNSINSVKNRIEGMWKERYAFHIMCADVGNKLHKFAESIGEDFDVYLPLKRMSKITGKY